MSKCISKEQKGPLLASLKQRFEENPRRHPGLTWQQVQAKLDAKPALWWSLAEMERTGGEPDVVSSDPQTGDFLIMDCAAESPKGRRSLCYDERSLASRKEHKPVGSAQDVAKAMGVELLTEESYRWLQQHHGPFDTKTSSWVLTPPDIRSLGGALFGDFRYGRVFFYHNGAESYFSTRGFRAVLRV
ncbi:MAG: DUF4256 domain-containing protein [Prosthecobacter sp.]|jgi:hypothetical protein|nr:DUF4256 domain-containing protein [Prosthecobacter sp.]